jgi:hypothetical protein
LFLGIICTNFISYQELIDATLPDLTTKSRDDYILGLQVLDAPLVAYYDTFSTALPCAVKSLARASLQSLTQSLQPPVPELGPLKEAGVLDTIRKKFTTQSVGTTVISRMDFALAFDPIATSDPDQLGSTSHLEPSVFDRTMKLITLDVAPYVRSIVAYDSQLQKQRLRLSNLMSEGGGRSAKRMRTTRAAYSALEGGSRSTTRRLKWFQADLNPYLVMRTAGEGWGKFTGSVKDATEGDASATEGEESERSAERPRGRKITVITDDSEDELC